MPRQSSLRVVLLQENVEYYQGIKGGREGGRAGMTGGQWLPHCFTAHMYWLLNILQSGISNKYFSEGAESWNNVSTFVLSLSFCVIYRCSYKWKWRTHCVRSRLVAIMDTVYCAKSKFHWIDFSWLSTTSLVFFSLLTNFNWHNVCCINQK